MPEKVLCWSVGKEKGSFIYIAFQEKQINVHKVPVRSATSTQSFLVFFFLGK